MQILELSEALSDQLVEQVATKVVRAVTDHLRSGDVVAPAYLTTEEAARFLSLSRSCLLLMRKRGEGPPCVNLTGSDYRYSFQDLSKWAARGKLAGGAQ